MLALDGGGLRGVIAIAFLERIERVLAERHGDRNFRLADYFDLIGGTSTGAIIATALALGRSASEIKDLYFNFGKRVFGGWRWRLAGLQPKFDHRPLLAILREQVGTRTMDSEDLRTGLAIITKRMDTGSPWVLTNNPRGKYWNNPPDGSYVGNRHYGLAEVVRASTAAPTYFEPERIRITGANEMGLFLDGGVSPHENPSLQLLMLSQMKGHGLCWPAGADNLLMISIGTGVHRHHIATAAGMKMTPVMLAAKALASMISDGNQLVLTMLQWMSHSPAPWIINSEIGNLAEDRLGPEPLLSFQRYDLPLEASGLLELLNEKISERKLERYRRLDDFGVIAELYGLAQRAAALQVADGHLPAMFDVNRK